MSSRNRRSAGTGPVFSFYPIPFRGYPIAKSIESLAALGYDGLELPGEALATRDVKDALSRTGMCVTAVCTRAYGEDRDLTAPEPAHRAAALEYYRGLIHMAQEFESPIVIVSPTPVRKTIPNSDVATAWKMAVDGIGALAASAEAGGVKLAIEPWNRYETFLINRVEDALRLADEVGSASVGVMGDLFHMNIEETDVATALRSAGDRLLNVHFADSNRRAPGEGHLELAPVFDALVSIGYRRALSVEYMPPRHIFETSVPSEYYEPYAEQTIRVLRAGWASANEGSAA
jgi:sugar phosphate isomerase/epimerase